MHDVQIIGIQANSATEKHSHKFCTMECVLAVDVPRTFRIGETPKNRINIDDCQYAVDTGAQLSHHPPVDRLHLIDRTILTKS